MDHQKKNKKKKKHNKTKDGEIEGGGGGFLGNNYRQRRREGEDEKEAKEKKEKGKQREEALEAGRLFPGTSGKQRKRKPKKPWTESQNHANAHLPSIEELLMEREYYHSTQAKQVPILKRERAHYATLCNEWKRNEKNKRYCQYQRVCQDMDAYLTSIEVQIRRIESKEEMIRDQQRMKKLQKYIGQLLDQGKRLSAEDVRNYYCGWFRTELKAPEMVHQIYCKRCHFPFLHKKKESLQHCFPCGKLQVWVNITNTATPWGQSVHFQQPHEAGRSRPINNLLRQFANHLRVSQQLLMTLRRASDIRKVKVHDYSKPTQVTDNIKLIDERKLLGYAETLTLLLNGHKVPRIQREQALMLKEMHKETEKLFYLLQGDVEEVNFKNRSSLLNFLCRITGWDEFRDIFPVQKTLRVHRKRSFSVFSMFVLIFWCKVFALDPTLFTALKST